MKLKYSEYEKWVTTCKMQYWTITKFTSKENNSFKSNCNIAYFRDKVRYINNHVLIKSKKKGHHNCFEGPIFKVVCGCEDFLPWNAWVLNPCQCWHLICVHLNVWVSKCNTLPPCYYIDLIWSYLTCISKNDRTAIITSKLMWGFY